MNGTHSHYNSVRSDPKVAHEIRFCDSLLTITWRTSLLQRMAYVRQVSRVYYSLPWRKQLNKLIFIGGDWNIRPNWCSGI